MRRLPPAGNSRADLKLRRQHLRRGAADKFPQTRKKNSQKQVPTIVPMPPERTIPRDSRLHEMMRLRKVSDPWLLTQRRMPQAFGRAPPLCIDDQRETLKGEGAGGRLIEDDAEAQGAKLQRAERPMGRLLSTSGAVNGRAQHVPSGSGSP